MCTSTARPSDGSERRSTSPSRSSLVTIWVMAGWVTCSLAVKSVSRRGPVVANVCSTDNVVKLSRWTAGNRMFIRVKAPITAFSSLTLNSRFTTRTI